MLFHNKVGAPKVHLLEKNTETKLEILNRKTSCISFEYGHSSKISLSKIPLDQNFHLDVCFN
eukprot:UN10304